MENEIGSINYKVLKNSGIWFLKLIFIIALFFNLAVLISLLSKQQAVIIDFERYYKSALDEFSGFSQLFSAIGGPNTVFLVLIALMITKYNGATEFGVTSLPSFIRDFIAVYVFTALCVMIFAQTGHSAIQGEALEKQIVNPLQSADYFVLSALVAIYFVVAISNFGGTLEKAKDTLKDLSITAFILLVGNLPSFIEGVLSRESILNYFFQIALIYIVTLNLKIFYFSEDFVTLELKSDAKKMGFSAAMTLLGWAFVGMAFALIGFLLFLIVSIFIHLDFTVNSPFAVVYSYLLIPTGFLIYLIKFHIFEFFSFLIAVSFSMGRYGEISDTFFREYDYETEHSISYKLLGRMPFSYNEKISRFMLLLGLFNLTISILVCLS